MSGPDFSLFGEYHIKNLRGGKLKIHLVVFLNMCVCVCVCSNANPLHYYVLRVPCKVALSVVYFRIMHCLGRPHYMWDEYLYSVREKVEVRVPVSVTVCIV